jgi:hypothetical protein
MRARVGMEWRMNGRLRRYLKNAAITIAVSMLIFALLEGLSSTVLFFRDLSNRPAAGPASVPHTRHDELLGWAPLPNVNIEDRYGAGRHYRTNSQGFRNDQEFATEEPPDRVRVICSGDSFTQGFGVSNEHAWCQQLASIDPRLESMNLAQAGYGIGQSYLRYMRDGAPFGHSVHILAYITEDFARLRRDTYLRWRKPRLAISDGTLEPDNVPVRQVGALGSWMSSLLPAVQELRSVELGSAGLRRFGLGPSAVPGTVPGDIPAGVPDSSSQRVMISIIDALLEAGGRTGVTLVLVHLPVRGDLTFDHPVLGRSSVWRRFIAREAEAREVEFIDMFEEFGRLPIGEIEDIYLSRAHEGLTSGRGHLSEYGNALVAERVYARLRALQGVGERLTGD